MMPFAQALVSPRVVAALQLTPEQPPAPPTSSVLTCPPVLSNTPWSWQDHPLP